MTVILFKHVVKLSTYHIWRLELHTDKANGWFFLQVGPLTLAISAMADDEIPF